MVTQIKLCAKGEYYPKSGSFFRVLQICVRGWLSMRDSMAVPVCFLDALIGVLVLLVRGLFAR
jgi:hypothetical protein